MERTLARTLQARDRRAVPSRCFIGMERQRMTFNLLDERWIPVFYPDGRAERVGIREALTNAGRIRQIAASNPMDNVALLRFLLALLYWCKGNPPEEGSATPGDPFPANWFSQLDANKDLFNLLGKGKRFYQCTDSQSKKLPEKLTANYLIHEIPTGTNKWHFCHSTDKVDGLCPACCAMGLLRLPLFSTSGGRGKPPGVNSKPPVYVIPVGVSLAETLWFSWRRTANLGTPAWEKPDAQLPKAGEIPLLLGLTWLPRRVWLENPEETKADCVSCGRSERLIRRCVFVGIGSTKTEADGPGRNWRDPHVIYGQSSKGDVISRHASDAIGTSDAAAGQWSKIVAGVLGEQKMNDRSSLWVVGFSTVKNDKYLEAMEYLIPCPCSLQQDQETIAKFERWQKEGTSLVRKLQPRNEKKSSRKHIEIPPALASIRPHVEDRVSAKVGKLIAGTDEAWAQAAAEYGPLMNMIARSLSPGFTTSAVQRRKQIANVLPDMRPKTGSAKKPSRKQGGDT